MRSVICRTLRHEFHFIAPDGAADEIRFIAADPELPDLQLRPVEIRIAQVNGYFSTRLPSGELVEGSANHIVHILHRVVFEDVVESEPDAPLIHGATVRIGGKRLLLVGHKGCGKSTLALHLAMAGHAVEGDEHLLVRHDDVIARPRTLRVKAGTAALIKNLPVGLDQLPKIVNWDGSVIRAVSPAVGGMPWLIRAGQLDGLVLLSANHGGRSAARPIDRGNALGRLMKEIVLPSQSVAAAAARVHRLLGTVPAYLMSLGDLNTATWHLQMIAKELTE